MISKSFKSFNELPDWSMLNTNSYNLVPVNTLSQTPIVHLVNNNAVKKEFSFKSINRCAFCIPDECLSNHIELNRCKLANSGEEIENEYPNYNTSSNSADDYNYDYNTSSNSADDYNYDYAHSTPIQLSFTKCRDKYPIMEDDCEGFTPAPNTCPPPTEDDCEGFTPAPNTCPPPTEDDCFSHIPAPNTCPPPTEDDCFSHIPAPLTCSALVSNVQENCSSLWPVEANLYSCETFFKKLDCNSLVSRIEVIQEHSPLSCSSISTISPKLTCSQLAVIILQSDCADYGLKLASRKTCAEYTTTTTMTTTTTTMTTTTEKNLQTACLQLAITLEKDNCTYYGLKLASQDNCFEYCKSMTTTTMEPPELTCRELAENVKNDCPENWPKESSPSNCREHFPTTTEAPELTCPELIENVKSDCSENWPKEISPVNCREHFPTTTEAPELTCRELTEKVKGDCSEHFPTTTEAPELTCRELTEKVKGDCSEHFPTTTEAPELTCPELIENVKSDCSENWPKEISPVNCREHFPTTTEAPELTCPELIENVKSDCSEHFPTTTEAPELTCPELIENVKSDCSENWPKEISPVNCPRTFPHYDGSP